MLRKMDVDVSRFKIELLKAIATTKKYSPSNSPPPNPPLTKKTMLKSGWIISDLNRTILTRVG